MIFEAKDLLDASTHDDCACMKRKYSVSLKDDFNSMRDDFIRYHFKLHHKSSGLELIIDILHDIRKRGFNDVTQHHNSERSMPKLQITAPLSARGRQRLTQCSVLLRAMCLINPHEDKLCMNDLNVHVHQARQL